MKMITVREFRVNPTQALKPGKKAEDVILTNNGKPVALLWPVNEDNLEESLKMARRARFERALHNIRKESVLNGTDKMTMEEVDEVIAEVRKEERQRTKRAR